VHHWEYQVIRLNIEPTVAEAPTQGPTAERPPSQEGTSEKMFSEAYLKEEFPRFYTNPQEAQQAAAAQARQADPAFQLQDFLNSQGQQGWELVGFQHAQPHVFIIFKRPAGASDTAQAAQEAQSEQLKRTLDLANRALAIIEKQAG
jgi:hypothetical protein